MAFYYLLLGHLIGDFVLQTNKIAEKKSTHWKWNLLHVVVVTFCMFILAFSFGPFLSALILVNGGIHFMMDFYKNRLCKIFHFSGLSGFILDQLVHLLLLYLISLTAAIKRQPLLDFESVKFLIMVVIITSFSAVFTQFVLTALFPRQDSIFFQKGEKYLGIITRIYVAIIFYIALSQSPYYLLLLSMTVTLFIFQFKRGWHKWMSPSHLILKLLLDTLIPAACLILFG